MNKLSAYDMERLFKDEQVVEFLFSNNDDISFNNLHKEQLSF